MIPVDESGTEGRVATRVCKCDDKRRTKYKTKITSGVETCQYCFRPIEHPADTEPPLPTNRVTTLQQLPGHRVVAILGIVHILTGSSGLTATIKGNEALDEAMSQLRLSARDMGANAIIGLTGSTFGAAGGITSVFGGDAVGVLLLGTAVTVVPEDRKKAQEIAKGP